MVRTLHRKLARDLWRLRSQCLTIALLVGCGIASFVAAVSAAASVQASRDAFYAQARFADVFTRLKAAPRPVLDRLRELPGVATVEGRVVGDYRVMIEGSDEAVVAHFVSISWPEEARLNQTMILSGRQVEPGSSDEIVLSATFAETWNLRPGSTLTAIINGRLAKVRIVGVAVSPEFVWASQPRTGLPDPWHFGVAWMDGDALAKALGLVGGFNDVAIQLAVNADEQETLHRVDAILEPYGGLGAVGRADQPSSRLVDQKIGQLQKTARTLPMIFLGVAAFLLHVLLSRIVGTQREQIATLKALGYRTRELTAHYLQLSLAICALGVVFGWGLGVLGSKSILVVYARYFRFSSYLFRFDAGSIAVATCVAVAAGVGGTFAAVRKAVAVPPAEAMRPEAPPTYHRTSFDRAYALFRPVARMVLRDAARRPWRLLLSAASIALATAIVVAGSIMGDSMDEVLRLQFEVSHREAVTVVLDEARPWRAVRDAAHIPGVRYAEGERQVPVRLRAGHRTRTTAILGIADGMDQHRLLGADRRPLHLPPTGLSLSRPLGESLGVQAGDEVEIEVLESDRRKVRLPVGTLVDDFLGIAAYMDATELSRLMGETVRANVVLLAVDPGDIDEVVQRLNDLPAVASVSRPSVDRGLVRAEEGDVLVVMQVILALFAAAIAVGVVYNNARIAYELRSRDLATMRILGFTRGELAVVLLGEQAIQVVLGVGPGLYLGRAIGGLSLKSIDRELFRIPISVAPASYVGGACVVLLAALLSALVVRRQSDRLDLVAVLKARD
ncbi:MAG TPA: ABC transporter permease [Polyangiaceae bacterium]|nr:ABC transporter permease [Polyangiaceae bacterium]